LICSIIYECRRTDIVSFTEAVQKASELGAFKYVETSSKSRKGIDELLNDKVLDMVIIR